MAESEPMFRFSPRPNRAHLVKWRPWGAEAFQEAQQQDKPLVLWLTAFWCGYCQRMDDTTLSNDEVIALLNAFTGALRDRAANQPAAYATQTIRLNGLLSFRGEEAPAAPVYP